MINYTGFNDIAINPATLDWISPAVVSEDYPVIAMWTVDGYTSVDGETF